jgi:K+-sensing histidine kinase KdpD
MERKADREHEADVRRDSAAPSVGPDPLANYQLLRLALHEMRTPITSVQLNAQLIERSLAKLGLDKEFRLAGTIVSAARKLDGLTQELGDTARLLSGKVALDLRVHDLARLLPEILSRHVGAPSSNSIRLEIPPGPLPIAADERCLDRILTNLVQIGFGLDASGTGIDLRVSAALAEVEISVTTPAAPGDASLALPSDEELGLGFCLARVLVELHGGKLQARRGPAREVVLCFSLPSPGRA